MDLDSQNGTYFEGDEDHLEPHVLYPLLDGSVIWFGHFGELGDGYHEPLIATVRVVYEGDLVRIGSMRPQSELPKEVIERRAQLGSEAGSDGVSGLGEFEGGPMSASHAHVNPASTSNAESEGGGNARSGHARRDAQRVFRGGESSAPAAESPSSGTKRKRSGEDEDAHNEDREGREEQPQQVSRRDHGHDESGGRGVADSPRRIQLQVPAPMTAAVATQTDPMLILPPAKRSRVGDSVRGAIGGAVAMWCALAFEGPHL
ncbi:hypothetical protein FRC10_001272 [Ceratobasidium sp. 414]|nr:hypothetical protein FRC10_001272 [Ceratobasidium sp. 414]